MTVLVITKRQYRNLLILTLIMLLAGVAASLIGESSLPPPLREYVQQQSDKEFAIEDIVLLVLSIAYLVAFIVSFVGLYRFWPPARPFYVVLTAIGYLSFPFVGPIVETGAATMFSAISTLLEGMILALIYFSPAAAWFEQAN